MSSKEPSGSLEKPRLSRGPEGPVDALIIAGEHSGDEHAARMVKAVMERKPGAAIAALGGPKLKEAGADLVLDMMPYAIIGFAEALKRYSEFRALRDAVVAWIEERRPSVVCFVDYPGFNLRVAQILHEKKLTRKSGGSIRLLYYISPQVWVWKASRRFKMARLLDSLGVIFPFEVQSFADTDLEVRFVGHPFLARDYQLPVRYDRKGAILLLPGSREGPIARIAPTMFKAVAPVLRERSDLRAVCVYASDTLKVLLASIIEGVEGLDQRIELVPNSAEVEASAVLTSSGTMSLNCALAGIPGAIVYKIHPATYLLGKMLVRVPYIGIANILLKDLMYTEFIQGSARPDALREDLENCLDNPERIASTQEGSGRLMQILDRPSAGGAGSWLIEFLERD